MIRRSFVTRAFIVAACFWSSAVFLSGAAIAQEGAVGGQQSSASTPGFTPNSVVIDKGSLTEKVSFLIGFNVMTNLKRQQAGEVNIEELFKGMQAATSGEDMKSFIAGYQMMSNFEEQGIELTLDRVFAGMTTASSGEELGMSDEEVKTLMTSFQKIIEKQQIEKMKKASADNTVAAEAYMKKNAADNPKIKTLDGGVQYEVLVEGTGAVPTISNRVKVDYHGTFLDGTVFDSSIKPPSGRPPAPAEFNVGGVVPGFSKALQNMKVGGKWRIVIPGQQAYGLQGGAGGMIGPNQALIFEITLLEILQ